MQGVYDSDTFTTKQAAKAWATNREAEIMAGARGEIPNLTVHALLERYKTKVSAAKKGRRWEEIRLTALQRDRIAQVRLKTLDTPHVSDWQERRLQDVSGASVRRERNLLNNVFEIARKEWGWLRKNPFVGVRRPKDGKSRSRIASQDELNKLLGRASKNLQRAITIAVETGMRAGEIASNPPVKGRVAYLVDSKNGEGREVPLSAKALEAMREPLGLTAGSISALFAQLADKCGIDGLTFHDLRHVAASRLAKKLDPWELCKMFGWKDMKIPLNTYYRDDPERTADKL